MRSARPDQFQRGLDLSPALAAAQTRQQQRQFDIFIRRQHGKQIERLENEADVLIAPIGELRFVQLGHVDALHDDIRRWWGGPCRR